MIAALLTGFQINSDLVQIPFDAGALVVQPIGPRAMRVRYSRNGKFPSQRVPTLIGLESSPQRTSIDLGRELTIRGDGIKATIDYRTGAIRFSNAKGEVFLAEAPGTRSLKPEILPGPKATPSFQAKQGFLLSRGEAIYGLGQHQDGLLDYRGTPVILEQVNREIAIPFFVSSNGYGVLWNNPSHTAVNVASKSSDLPNRQEFDEVGKAGGFTARYYLGENFEKLISTKRESSIEHDWDKTAPPGMTHDHYSVRWTGSILATQSANYVFKTESDDGVRLWIDDKPVIDNWTVHAPTLNVAKVRFLSGTRHKFKLDFFQAGGGAIIRMHCGIEQPTNLLELNSEAADVIDYCVFYGPSIDKVIAGYRHATGEAPMPPISALGFWQSKERYSTQQEWFDIASEYRRKKHPIDNLVQDWFYWDPSPWGSHQLDPIRYPDPAAAIARLHDEFHLQFMISVWGKFIAGSSDHPNANLDAMDSKGFLYPKIASNERYYDAFNPLARKLYWDQMRNQLFSLGVDAWWLDASEPEVYMHDFRAVPTAAGLGAQVLNAWPLMHTIGVSQGQLAAAPNKRVFILTRSAYAGQQRTGAACWSGDISATWQVYANQIPAGLNFCLSGIPYWTTDIGAFFVPGGLYPKHAADPAYRELFTRWFQYGSFCPIFRVHGTDLAKEMWRFGPETEKILNTYDELRYRLMPYIYSQAHAVTAKGGTLMRALVMDFPHDESVRNIKDEFMFGPSLLICPVIQPTVHSRAVYLPAGTRWFDFWTGKSFAGGKTIVADAPIEKLPIFVRAGSILPMGPVMQYTDEKPTDPLELRVYPGADGKVVLYEDEGNNNNYRKGRYSEIDFMWNQRLHTLTAGKRRGSFPGMKQSRGLQFKMVGSGVGGVAETNEMAIEYHGVQTEIQTFPLTPRESKR